MEEEDLSYKTLSTQVGAPGLYRVSQDRVFWVLRMSTSQEPAESENEVTSPWGNVGWKIHVSLAEEPENIQKAWDCIIDLLSVYKIKVCKVLMDGEQLPALQLGKEMTLYYQPHLIHWNDLLNDMTKRFVQAGVRPGYLAFNDECVEGSSFFSFRNDEGEKGVYVSSLFTEGFNPSHKPLPDDWKKLKITELNQPLRPVRQNEKELKEFYKKIMIEVRGCSINFIELLKPFSFRLNALDKGLFIWTLDKVRLEAIVAEFPEEVRDMVSGLIYEIKDINRAEYDDFAKCSAEEINILNENFRARFSSFERTLKAAAEQCQNQKISDTACIDSGNTSPAKSSSNEGSPRKDEDQTGPTVVEPPGK